MDSEAQRAFLALAGGDPGELLAEVAATRNAPLLVYCRAWLSLVAQELRSELQDALLPASAARGGKLPQWQVASSGAPAGGGACRVSIKASADGSLHGKLLLCSAHNLLLLLTSEPGGPRRFPQLWS